MQTEQLLDEVLHLPHAARALMAERLLASLDADEDEDAITAAWCAEARAREMLYATGKSQMYPAAEVHARIEAKLAELRAAR